MEIVIFRAEMFGPQCELSVRMASVTLAKLARGSPMPMKTTLVIRSCAGARI